MGGGVSKGDELLRAWQRYWLVKLVRPEHQTGFWSLSFVVTKLLILRIGRISIGISLFIANAKLESRCKALTTSLPAGLAPTLSARPRKPRSDRCDLA
jgi:hypothetical protein